MRPLSPPSLRGRHAAGNSLVPILIIVAALGISTAIFFLFTKKKMEAGKAAEMAVTNAPTQAKETASAPSKPVNEAGKPAGAASTAATPAAMPAAVPGAPAPAAPAPAS
ncbi:MAG: hypothetical protein ACK5ZM_00630, partial [bacterium]